MVLCALNVARAFDSCIFSHVLLEVLLKGTDAAVINSLRYMYRNLKTGIKDGSQLFPILKGGRQGALTSPVLFNNCVTSAQDKLDCTFILKEVDLLFVMLRVDLAKPFLHFLRMLFNLRVSPRRVRTYWF